MRVSTGRHHWLAIALVAAGPAFGQINQQQGVAPARGPDAPKPGDADKARADGVQTGVTDPNGNAPIIPDSEFNAALPPLSGDINAPLEPMPVQQAATPAATPATTVAQTPLVNPDGTLPAAAPENPELAQPLQPLATFDTAPLQTVADIKDADAPQIRYDVQLKGLDKLDLAAQFTSLSA